PVRGLGRVAAADRPSQRGARDVRRAQPVLPRESHLHRRPRADVLAGRARRPAYPGSRGATMSDLTSKEQRSVRTTLLFLRVRSGGVWEPVAKALNAKTNTISKVVAGSREVDASLAIRVARLLG